MLLIKVKAYFKTRTPHLNWRMNKRLSSKFHLHFGNPHVFTKTSIIFMLFSICWNLYRCSLFENIYIYSTFLNYDNFYRNFQQRRISLFAKNLGFLCKKKLIPNVQDDRVLQSIRITSFINLLRIKDLSKQLTNAKRDKENAESQIDSLSNILFHKKKELESVQNELAR